MKKVDPESLIVSISKNKETNISDDAINLINDLFRVFEVHISSFTYYASSNEKINFAKKEWVLCFQKACIELEEVKVGVNKLRENGFTYMITPAQFIKLCRPQKEIKPQSDTADRSYMFSDRIESDELKNKKKENAFNHLNMIKNSLS